MKSSMMVSLSLKAIKTISIILFSFLFLSASYGQTASSKAGNNTTVTNNAATSYIEVTLWRDIESVSTKSDGAVLLFNNLFSNELGQEDALKLINGSENIGIYESGSVLSIDGLPEPKVNQVINISLDNLNTTVDYLLKVEAKQFIVPGLKPYIVDAYLNKELPADSSITFMPSGDTTTYKHRFSIIFRVADVLGLKFTSFKGYKDRSSINLTWVTASESNMSKLVLEKSYNGIDFNKVASFAAQNKEQGVYNYSDLEYKVGKNYYRVAAADLEGKIILSSIIQVNVAKVNNQLTIYPNPVKRTQQLNLAFNVIVNDNVSIRIYDTKGALISDTRRSVSTGQNTLMIDTYNIPSAGNYFLSLIFDNQENATYSNTQFIVR